MKMTNKQLAAELTSLRQRIRELEVSEADLKQAQQNLREGEQKFRAIVENVPDQLAIIDREGTISFINYPTPGDSPESFLGTKFYDHMIPSAIETHREIAQHAFQTGETHHAIVRTSTNRVFDCRTAPLKKGGTVEHLIVIFTEITDRKRAEEALRQSEARYRHLFDSAPDGVLVIDGDGLITDCSHNAMLLYGYPKEEMVGKYITEFMPPSSVRELSVDLAQGTPIEGETRIVRSDETIVPVWRKGVPLSDSDGNLFGMLVYDSDITDRKRAEELLRHHRNHLEKLVKERTSSLEEANTALRVMLKTADQIKTEMAETVILNVKNLASPYLEVLKKSEIDDKQKKYLDMLSQSLDQITAPFLQGVSPQSLSLTPTEIKVINLVKQGKTTKEIASLLEMSAKTVENHRYSIRTKLGINNKPTNLRTYISSLD